MNRSLFLPGASRRAAEDRYRRIITGSAPTLEAYLSEPACRALIANYPEPWGASCRLWLVSERFGPDGRMVTAEDVTDNVVPLRRDAHHGQA